MTRRRFYHCQNEKCLRRLEEIPKALEEHDPPAPPAHEYCEACLAMMVLGDRTGSRLGFSAGKQEAYIHAAVFVGLLLVVYVAYQIATAYAGG